jgi:aspartyl-tRNA(Asn)/glutamyl-tRNA(Gln) amidotransferase subunit C
MPTFTRDEVQRLAALARLELSSAETEVFARQLGDVLEFVRQIQAVDTSSVALASNSLDTDMTMREDLVVPSLERAEVLGAAPAADHSTGLFKVPRVLNG